MSAEVSAEILDRLFARLEERRGADSASSYTARLYAAGIDKILQKVGEEAVETIIAAKSGDSAAIISESADLLYHLLVMLAALKIPPEAVYSELQKRFSSVKQQ